jgi:hypothetical protein
MRSAGNWLALLHLGGELSIVERVVLVDVEGALSLLFDSPGGTDAAARRGRRPP